MPLHRLPSLQHSLPEPKSTPILCLEEQGSWNVNTDEGTVSTENESTQMTQKKHFVTTFVGMHQTHTLNSRQRRNNNTLRAQTRSTHQTPNHRSGQHATRKTPPPIRLTLRILLHLLASTQPRLSHHTRFGKPTYADIGCPSCKSPCFLQCP